MQVNQELEPHRTQKISSAELTMLDVVCRDINSYLNQSTDRQKRLNFLSRKIEVHKKTLVRILAKKNEPSYPTLIKLYRFLLNVENDIEVFDRVDEAVKGYLEKAFSKKEVSKQSYSNENLKIFTENSAALDLYILACVKKISKAEIKLQYGEFGIRLCQQLLAEGFISETSPEVFSEGPKKVAFSPDMIRRAGLMCMQVFSKPQNAHELGKNFLGFFAESLNAEAYLEWIRIDEEAFAKKISIALQATSKGNIPAFTFTTVDTLKIED